MSDANTRLAPTHLALLDGGAVLAYRPYARRCDAILTVDGAEVPCEGGDEAQHSVWPVADHSQRLCLRDGGGFNSLHPCHFGGVHFQEVGDAQGGSNAMDCGVEEIWYNAPAGAEPHLVTRMGGIFYINGAHLKRSWRLNDFDPATPTIHFNDLMGVPRVTVCARYLLVHNDSKALDKLLSGQDKANKDARIKSSMPKKRGVERPGRLAVLDTHTMQRCFVPVRDHTGFDLSMAASIHVLCHFQCIALVVSDDGRVGRLTFGADLQLAPRFAWLYGDADKTPLKVHTLRAVKDYAGAFLAVDQGRRGVTAWAFCRDNKAARAVYPAACLAPTGDKARRIADACYHDGTATLLYEDDGGKVEKRAFVMPEVARTFPDDAVIMASTVGAPCVRRKRRRLGADPVP